MAQNERGSVAGVGGMSAECRDDIQGAPIKNNPLEKIIYPEL